MRAFLVSTSLFDAGRLRGFKTVSLAELEKTRPGPDDLIAVDLAGKIDVNEIIAVAGGATVVGYFPHVDKELGEAARRAGCRLVLPRSKFFRLSGPEALLAMVEGESA